MKTVMDFLKHYDIRWDMFMRALRYVNTEMVEGDILEFGCYTGRSLALLSCGDKETKDIVGGNPLFRRVVGFDSFQGLGENDHPNWPKGLFRDNHSFHPCVLPGGRASPELVMKLFDVCGLPPPILEIGVFEDVLDSLLKSKYSKVSIVHIDCDLYESTLCVLKWIEELLSDGSIVLFDDWFNFRNNPFKGEQRAFNEFVNGECQLKFTDYGNYATFAKAFIVNRV